MLYTLHKEGHSFIRLYTDIYFL